MIRRLFALLTCFAFSAVASATTFVTPQPEQTGSYLASVVSEGTGALTPLEHTGVFLEVIPAHGSVDGYITPRLFNWGFVVTTDITLLFQSPVPPTAVLADGRSYEIDVGKTVVENGNEFNVILGHGVLTYDPLTNGSGSTIDLVVTFDAPTTFKGATYDRLHLRMRRLQRDVAIYGCDRSGDTGGFSPPPPPNLCNR